MSLNVAQFCREQQISGNAVGHVSVVKEARLLIVSINSEEVLDRPVL